MLLSEIEFLPDDYEGDDYEEMTIEEFYENVELTEQQKKQIYEKYGFSVNIHCMIAEETFDKSLELIDQVIIDPRVEKLNAIVFLSLKQKGRGTTFTPLNIQQFEKIVDKSRDNNINFGFDSCGSSKFLNVSKKYDDYKSLALMVEPCESSLFSFYTDVNGHYYPCSFCEGEQEWKTGLDVTNCKDFLKDIWFHPKTHSFREKLLKNSRNCPMFDI